MQEKKPYFYLTEHLLFIVYVSSRLKHFFLISLSNNNAKKVRILTHYYVGYVYNVYLFDSTQSRYRERSVTIIFGYFESVHMYVALVINGIML